MSAFEWTGLDISIHALHEESDVSVSTQIEAVSSISIHALHEESDHGNSAELTPKRSFQSTLSMRRATAFGHAGVAPVAISIHALHEESDVSSSSASSVCRDFNPRSP